jgi:hypothetical protein
MQQENILVDISLVAKPRLWVWSAVDELRPVFLDGIALHFGASFGYNDSALQSRLLCCPCERLSMIPTAMRHLEYRELK